MRDIKRTIDTEVVKKIFANKVNAISFLQLLGKDSKVLNKLKPVEVYGEVVRQWDYEKARVAIRQLFKQSKKFSSGTQAEHTIEILLTEWQQLGLGNVDWPFSQGQFDAFVQSLNSEESNRTEKDEKVKIAAVKYRRIKELNTERNDFLETLVFLKNEQIIPTLSHSKGVDFFIDGISFDQKVARSVTTEFKRDFGVAWRAAALEHPEKVAEYLYTYQDEGRFGAIPRLFIVYLDENISPLKIKQTIEEATLNLPLEVTFNFKHKDGRTVTYRTFAFVILLTND
ncbi:hypothetical protein SAMN05444369_11361 [Capnocytophaga haemolytica]|uniref:Restriction endonuclease n=1 Tax=Capnocytophaga haemolytica TaxID=45243 RepID=A0AAX2GY22_9FLAO|nr:hypothetical protein [Capnocytophaga haemolytica]AMD84668.1 hypothetical protein AXF12_03480 [Capnocytophaga haemolytica]SFO21343.1 hypothetical protein SAMN05444369_11361 [Capnocytophaga haemolytica]SNV08552.1 Uncharacterised protein [Capnocytophaga haemolytica]